MKDENGEEINLGAILYALELDHEPSSAMRIAAIRSGGVAPKDELLAKWQVRTSSEDREMILRVWKNYRIHRADVMKSPEHTIATSPGLIKKAGNLAKAVAAETKAIAHGQAKLSAQQVAERLAACAACEFLKANRSCAKCGCFVDAKARFRTQGCPLNKWPLM